ncbi:MAG TPA: thioredoxin [Cryomorphaceae bacterium]|nr:thioredoxin [Cryomorphaceae bacterium]
MALELTDKNFDEITAQTDKPVLVDFWAAWCGPCRTLGPIVDEIAKEYEGKAIVGKINVDENPDLSTKFSVRTIPTILFIKDGEVVDKSVGVASKDALTQKLDAHMN